MGGWLCCRWGEEGGGRSPGPQGCSSRGEGEGGGQGRAAFVVMIVLASCLLIVCMGVMYVWIKKRACVVGYDGKSGAVSEQTRTALSRLDGGGLSIDQTHNNQGC